MPCSLKSMENGATVYIQSKYVCLSEHIRANLINLEKGHKLQNCIVFRQEVKKSVVNIRWQWSWLTLTSNPVMIWSSFTRWNGSLLLTNRAKKTTSLTPPWLQGRREHKKVPKRLNVHMFRQSCWSLARKWGKLLPTKWILLQWKQMATTTTHQPPRTSPNPTSNLQTAFLASGVMMVSERGVVSTVTNRKRASRIFRNYRPQRCSIYLRYPFQ